MTQAELAAKISSNLNENSVFFYSIDLQNSIQDGYDEITALTGVKDSVAIITTGTTYYDLATLIPDLISVRAIYNPVTKQWLDPVSLLYLEKLRPNWENCVGAAECFWIVNYRYIAIFRQPAAQSLYVFYKAAAPTLASNTVLEFPNEYLKTIEEYSTGDLLETQQEWERARVSLDQYVEDIGNFSTWVNNKDAGRRWGLKR